MPVLRKHFSPLNLAIAALLAAGLLLRLRQYFSGRSLWLDEAMLALNIVQRDFLGLLKPLDYDQGAPLGFLLAQKLVASLFSDGELSLRLLPLLAGIAALLLYPLLLGRFLKPAGLLTALALFAANPGLVYYSSELKQYNVDVLAAMLVALCLPQMQNGPLTKMDDGEKPGFSPSSISRLILIGCVLPWFSHPAIFMLAGLGLTLLWQARHHRQNLAWYGLVIALWLLSFALLMTLSLGGLMSNRYLLDYWGEFFMPLSADLHAWLAGKIPSLFSSTNLVNLIIPGWLGLLLAALGAIQLFQKDRHWLGVLLLPLFFTLAASALRIYPFGERMLLFCLPLVIALLAAGLERFSAWVNAMPWGLGTERAVALILAGILCFGPTQTSLKRLIEPVVRENMHPALSTLRAKYRPNDPIYVYYGAVPAFLYYAPRYGFVETKFQAGRFSQQYIHTPEILNEIKPLRGQPRAWFLFAHVYEQGSVNQQEQLLNLLEEWGKCKVESREKRTSVTLYLCNLKSSP